MPKVKVREFRSGMKFQSHPRNSIPINCEFVLYTRDRALKSVHKV